MDLDELKQRQSWTLEQKIDHSLGAIESFYNATNGNVFVSFSGGKDSCVLLHLCRILYPNIKAVFCNTKNEYPEIVSFVRELKESGENIDIIYPTITPKEVMERVGFPLISKQVSHKIASLKQGKGNIKDVPAKFRFLIDEPFSVSDQCCRLLKKDPLFEYQLKNGLFPIVGVMAEESSIRAIAYMSHGQCNFTSYGDRVQSWPLAIWKASDIWNYIKKYKVPISKIYKKGAKRTGCAFCGFGCHMDDRLEYLLVNHPKMYETFLQYTNNGVTYKEALTKVMASVNRTLPDINPENTFNLIDL